MMKGLRKPFPHRTFDIETQLSPMEARGRLSEYAGKIGARIVWEEWLFSMSLFDDHNPSLEINGSIGLRAKNTAVLGEIDPAKRVKSGTYIALLAVVAAELLFNMLAAVGSGMWRAAAVLPVSAVLGYFGWKCMRYLPAMGRICLGMKECLANPNGRF